LRVHAGISRANLSNPVGDDGHLRWTLDFPEDFEFFRAIYHYLPADRIATTAEVKQVLAKHPELSSINAGRHDASRPANMP